jgi:hypothetical protein
VAQTRPHGRRFLGIFWGLALVAMAGAAQAVTIPLDVELDTGVTDNWGTIEVAETANHSLLFEIHLSPALGPNADIHNFYFNLAGDAVATEVVTLDPVLWNYSLRVDPPVNGGAGTDFDYAVFFGNGAGRRGNRILQDVHFELLGVNLDVDALTSAFSTTASGIPVLFALHVQGTDTYLGADSETVAAMVPEPGTALLLAVGLIPLALVRREGLRGRLLSRAGRRRGVR